MYAKIFKIEPRTNVTIDVVSDQHIFLFIIKTYCDATIHFNMLFLLVKYIFSLPLSMSHCEHFHVCETLNKSMLTDICKIINRIESYQEAQIIWENFLDVDG